MALNNRLKESNFNFFLDFIFMIVCSVGSLSVVRYITYDIIETPFDSYLGLLIFAFIIFSLRFKFNYNLSFKFIKNAKLVFLLLAIYLWEALQAMNNGVMGKFGTYLCLFLYTLISTEYMYRLYKHKYDICDVTKHYTYYSIYATHAIILCAILILAGVLSRYDNPIELAIFSDNASRGTIYYFPGYLSIVGLESRFLSYLGLPVFDGLCHEPHVFCYSTFPAVFLVLYQYRTKNIALILSIIMSFVLVVMVTSATSLLCLGVIIIVSQLWNFFVQKSWKSILVVLLMVPLLIFFIQSDLYEAMSMFMMEKTTDSDTGDYSFNLLQYVVSPQAFVGLGINPPIDIAQGFKKDIGYVSSVMIISFYCLLLFYTIRNVISKNHLSHYIGLACLYFCMHTLKMSVLTFNYTYLVFIVVLITFADLNRKSKTI